MGGSASSEDCLGGVGVDLVVLSSRMRAGFWFPLRQLCMIVPKA